jgi:hypothetical protein
VRGRAHTLLDCARRTRSSQSRGPGAGQRRGRAEFPRTSSASLRHRRADQAPGDRRARARACGSADGVGMRITDAGCNTACSTIAREPGATFSAKKCRLAVLRARECEIATAQAVGGFFGSATVCGRCTGLSFFFDALLASSRDPESRSGRSNPRGWAGHAIGTPTGHSTALNLPGH